MGLAKIVAYVFIVVAVVALAVFVMGQFEQTRPIYDTVVGYVVGAKDWITGSRENLTATVASVGSLAAVGGVALNSISGLKKKLSDATAEKDAVASKISSITDKQKELEEKAAGYESQIADYEKQLKDASIDGATVNQIKNDLSTAQNNLTTVQQQKASLQNQYDDLKREADKMRAQLEVLTPKVK